jgi:hypothetical protein
MWAVARITPSRPAPSARPRLGQPDAQAETAPADLPTFGRALVLVGSGQETAVDPPGSRPSAMFLAQLIATAQQAPQTRRRRRAEAGEAGALYAAASAPAAVPSGRAFCRSL